MELVGEVINFIGETFGEIVAIFHWLSNAESLIELLNLMSQLGSLGGLAFWLLSSLLSSIVAESLKSKLPTILRPIFKALIEE